MKMKNSILDHIEGVLLNQRRPETKSMSFRLIPELDDDLSRFSPVGCEFRRRWSLTLWVDTWVRENNPRPEEEAQRAKMAIAWDIYGDVVNALHVIRRGLWEEGMPGDCEPIINLDALIEQLEGSFSRIE